MKLTLFIFFWSIGFFLSSCSEQKSPLESRVMAIHDSIMPGMSEIMTLNKSLELELGKTDSLLRMHPTDTVLVARQSRLYRLVTNLRQADQAMMDWMHTYQPDTLTKLDDSQKERYLQHQKKAIEIVRDQMKQSVQEAQSFQP